MNSALITLLATTLADPLARFNANQQPIAHVGLDVPLDILLACGRPFCHLPWRKGRATPHADRWLESSFPGWARSILEDWLNGAFDMFERVIFTRGDDAAQRLYYYLCELQRRGIAGGPTPCIFDVALIRRDASVRHCERAVRALQAELGISDSALETGISQANRQRVLFARLDRNRGAAGHFYENIVRASLFCDLAPQLDGLLLAPTAGARRVLLAGSVPPDDMFHRAVENSGWNIVGEAHQLNLTRHGLPLAIASGDPAAQVARHYNALGGGARAFGDRAATLVDAALRTAADAVVLWLTEEDESLAWDVARQRAALSQAAVPHLVLTRRRWDGADAATDEVCTFLEELPA